MRCFIIPDSYDKVLSVQSLSKDTSHPYTEFVYHHQHALVFDIIEGHTAIIFVGGSFSTRHLGAKVLRNFRSVACDSQPTKF